MERTCPARSVRLMKRNMKLKMKNVHEMGKETIPFHSISISLTARQIKQTRDERQTLKGERERNKEATGRMESGREEEAARDMKW